MDGWMDGWMDGERREVEVKKKQIVINDDVKSLEGGPRGATCQRMYVLEWATSIEPTTPAPSDSGGVVGAAIRFRSIPRNRFTITIELRSIELIPFKTDSASASGFGPTFPGSVRKVRSPFRAINSSRFKRRLHPTGAYAPQPQIDGPQILPAREPPHGRSTHVCRGDTPEGFRLCPRPWTAAALNRRRRRR